MGPHALALGHAWIQQAYTPDDPPAHKEVVLAPWLNKASPCLAINLFVQFFSFRLTSVCLAGPIARNQQITPPSFFQDQDCGSNGRALAPNFGEVAAAAKCRAQDHVSATQSSSCDGRTAASLASAQHAFVQGSNSISCRAAHLPGGKNNDCLCFLLERMQCPPAFSSKHMCFVSMWLYQLHARCFFPM